MTEGKSDERDDLNRLHNDWKARVVQWFALGSEYHRKYAEITRITDIGYAEVHWFYLAGRVDEQDRILKEFKNIEPEQRTYEGILKKLSEVKIKCTPIS